MRSETSQDHPLESEMKVVVEKRRFLRDLDEVESVLGEYDGFLRTLPERPDWEGQALELAAGHLQRLNRAQVTLQTIELVAAILRHSLERLTADSLRFRMPADGGSPGAEPGEEADAAARTERLSLLVSELHGLVQQAPLAMQEKLRILLASFSNLFNGLIAGAAAPVEEATDQINLITSSRESQNLIREIAFITRRIYDSLDAFSADLPLQDLNESAEGMSEAVRKLNSVMGRLEQAANHNLDALEAHLGRVKRSRTAMAKLLEDLREGQRRLGRLKLAHPEVASRLTQLQDELGDGIGSRVMLLCNRAELNRDSLISMTANQSFQDLTGQTLKKIIAFIQNLEAQIVALLEKYRPVLGLTAPKRSGPKAAPAARIEGQNQDQVDALLADLGF